jgi:hypothetical protein
MLAPKAWEERNDILQMKPKPCLLSAGETIGKRFAEKKEKELTAFSEPEKIAF